MRPHGFVTNVLRRQLEGGAALAELIGGAQRRGFTCFELRQRALGECEDADCIPVPARCAALRRQFPEAEFNLAIEFPVFSRRYTIHEPLYLAARDAAFELRRDRGHLRFVDPTLNTTLLGADDHLEEQAECLHLLVVDAEASGVRVSIEHSRQPLSVTRELIRRAARHLESSGLLARGILGVCLDPCNLLHSALQREDPVTAVASLPAEDIFMFHIKQSRQGAALTDVGTGDVDWPAVLRVMVAREYDGPVLFEIAPGENVWENLERSRDYIDGLLG